MRRKSVRGENGYYIMVRENVEVVVDDVGWCRRGGLMERHMTMTFHDTAWHEPNAKILK